MIASNKLRVLVGIAVLAFSLLCAVLAGREFDRSGTVVNKEMETP